MTTSTTDNASGINSFAKILKEPKKKEQSFVILNAGWDFSERRLQFQSMHSSFALARKAIKSYIDTPAMYNIVQLIEVTPDQGGTRAEETWKLHNNEFYRDSIFVNGLYNTDNTLFGKDVQRLLTDEQLNVLYKFLARQVEEYTRENDIQNKAALGIRLKTALYWWFNELGEGRTRY